MKISLNQQVLAIFRRCLLVSQLVYKSVGCSDDQPVSLSFSQTGDHSVHPPANQFLKRLADQPVSRSVIQLELV